MFSNRRWLLIIGLVLGAALLAVGVFFWWGAVQRAQAPVATQDSSEGDKIWAEFEARTQAESDAAREAKLIRLTPPEGRAMEVFLAADSLGAGYHATTLKDAYRSRVEAGLESRGFDVNLTLATKPDDAPLFQITTVDPVPDEKFDLAIIELGTNDAGRTDPDEFVEAYQVLIDQIRSQSPSVPLLCLGVWGQPNEMRTSYDKLIRTTCQENDGRYVSLAKSYSRGDTWGPEGRKTWVGPSDNFHPNDIGHEEIADLILERLPAN